jgi:protein phosphatase
MTTSTIPDPSLVVIVGPAGSGKSTLARRLFAADEILSSDALRAVVAGDEADQSASRSAFSILHRELARRLAGGKLTVVDATNLRREHRRPLLARARQAGVPAIAIVLDLPADVVRAQNAGRARVVDADVIDRHLAWLRRSVDDGQLAAEGFAPVIVLRTPVEVAGLRIDRVPLSPAPLSRPP